jgi:uroporphyrin-III C-methyltransferase
VTVHLVGAGPGSVDSLTVGALRLLQRADVVVHDRLVDDSVLACLPARAERIDVGKRKGVQASQSLINELLISLDRRHRCVVRLKGGDPFVFGRGGEELLALRAAGVEVEVVPGVTSAFAAPAAAEIPVTHRGVARGVLVITGHTDLDPAIDFSALSRGGVTIVILMGVASRAEIARHLIARGLGDDTPVAVIERAFTTGERTVYGKLADLGSMEVTSPAVIVIGEVATIGRVKQRELVGVERD